MSQPMADGWDDLAPSWDDEPATRAYSVAAAASLRDVLAGRGRTLVVASSVCAFLDDYPGTVVRIASTL
jgi:hypothetical protein